MTWLYDKSAAQAAVPVDLLADGLFAPRAVEGVHLLEFGAAFPPPVVEDAEPLSDDPAGREAAERARQVRIMVDTAREEAVAEARATLELEWSGRLQRERARVDSILALFAEERARWFRQSESEIVDLALAIARQVLHRELHTDPLALRDIVGEALGRVQDGSGVVLRVAPTQVPDWRGAFRSRADLEIVPDPGLPEDGCVMETTFGRVEFGVETQLEELAERFREMVGGPRRVEIASTEPGGAPIVRTV